MYGLALLPDQLELCNFKDWIKMVKSICLLSVHFLGHVRGHFWPCWDYVCPNFISRPPTDLKWLNHYDLRLMSMEWLLFEPISMRFLDHACPSFTSRPAKAHKFWRLSQHGLRHTSMKCPLFGTMSGPCFYHVKNTFGIYLLSDELELWKFQDWVNKV